MMRFTLVYVVGLFLAGMCSTVWHGAGAGGGEDSAPKHIRLRPGQRAHVSGTGVSVEFVSVGEDSRCPQGVQCVWAGSVRINLRLRGPKSEISAPLNSNRQPRVVEFGGLFFSVAQVEPPKVEGRRIKPEEYLVTLSASRRPPAGADVE